MAMTALPRRLVRRQCAKCSWPSSLSNCASNCVKSSKLPPATSSPRSWRNVCRRRSSLGGGELRGGARLGRQRDAVEDQTQRKGAILAVTPRDDTTCSAVTRARSPEKSEHALEATRNRTGFPWAPSATSSWVSKMASPGRHASLSGCLSVLPSSEGSSDAAMAKPAARTAVFRFSILMAQELWCPGGCSRIGSPGSATDPACPRLSPSYACRRQALTNSKPFADV